GKGEPAGVRAGPILRGANCAGSFVARRRNAKLPVLAIRAERPLDEVRNRDAPGASRIVTQPESEELDRIGDGHEYSQFLADAVAVVLERGVVVAVASAIRVPLADGQRSGSPQRPAFVVMQINDLRLRIAHRIVGPRREPV